MFEFENTQYPQLQVASVAGRVRFEAGRFVTDDAPLAEALIALPDWYGIRLVSAPETEPEPVTLERPAKSASKADWVAYAVQEGMDEAEAETATRDELAAKYADGGGD